MYTRFAPDPALARAAEYGRAWRARPRPLHPAENAAALRRRFCVALPETGRPAEEVISSLIDAAEPGLVGNTQGGFHAWVMGGSDTAGVAADWLTSVWGQNAAIYQTAPAAAIAEEAVSAWLLDLLDLPRAASVGFVTGATMAGFTCLAAARSAVLQRHGHDFERHGLQRSPKINVFLSDESHASNVAALGFLGLGRDNLQPLPSDAQGVMNPQALALAMAARPGPKIVIAQAGQINTGGFDDFREIAEICRAHGAWLHVDGAFGLWLRALPEKADVTAGIELADSWSVDGHKWLQLPYDSGFAIIRDPAAHRRAMDISAAYLNSDAMDGRNPTEFNPELSRRARGFAAWAVLQSLGREGLRDMIRRHCQVARQVAQALSMLRGVTVLTPPVANQIILTVRDGEWNLTEDLAAHLNASGQVFVRTTRWKGETVLRLSVIAGPTAQAEAEALITLIAEFCGAEVTAA